MLTFIAFLLTILGCINWLLIGLLQYDFIAGLFGYQASIFSRMIYILFGIGAIYLTLRIIINKGTFKVYEKRKKRSEEMKKQENKIQPAQQNVEAGKEQISKEQYDRQAQSKSELEDIDTTSYHNGPSNFENMDYFEENYKSSYRDNLFDEHFKDKF